ncbi:RES domain-containing protein [Gemmobacter caeni]|uniref:RES domain-containing protein n=1 Tax=Gemmobacter caeni TaxID=589035 RepID=A0A2T6ADI6_9RHOB|nr:RES family NAD+ phosphorylase [Gemmobacter caeni]PTX41832.1 RES domain-containing protein [Gemmobacter caeni]TWI90605.1 RES domain-containing protein [Gemmobacter caeni]
MRPPTARVIWDRYHRLINSAYPPIDLFEDIADPADWLLLASAESKTNPRLAASIGNLDLVPAGRRVGGPRSSYVMAPFTHVSPDHRGRFHDGTFGAFYAADDFETALFETIHHTLMFCAATREAPGWIADKRELIGRIDADLTDIRHGYPHLLDPDDYTASQAFALAEKAAGSVGIVYPSVRNPGGTCFAAFYPDVMSPPVQGRHLTYHWNGAAIDMVKDLGNSQVFAVLP